MTEIILTGDQSQQWESATDGIVISNAAGNVVANIPPTPRDLSTEQQKSLDALRGMVREAEEDAAAGRVGHFDVDATMARVEERLAREAQAG